MDRFIKRTVNTDTDSRTESTIQGVIEIDLDPTNTSRINRKRKQTDDSNGNHDGPVPKLKKTDSVTAKKHCYLCTYNKTLHEKYPWTNSSTKQPEPKQRFEGYTCENFFFCKICECDICLALDGGRAIARHETKDVHQDNIKLKEI